MAVRRPPFFCHTLSYSIFVYSCSCLILTSFSYFPCILAFYLNPSCIHSFQFLDYAFCLNSVLCLILDFVFLTVPLCPFLCFADYWIVSGLPPLQTAVYATSDVTTSGMWCALALFEPAVVGVNFWTRSTQVHSAKENPKYGIKYCFILSTSISMSVRAQSFPNDRVRLLQPIETENFEKQAPSLSVSTSFIPAPELMQTCNSHHFGVSCSELRYANTFSCCFKSWLTVEAHLHAFKPTFFEMLFVFWVMNYWLSRFQPWF